MFRSTLFVFGFASLLAAPAAADNTGPSFDCAKASTTLEHAICDNATLSSLDAGMASIYEEALNASNDPDALRREQRDWADQRGPSCGIVPGADDDAADVSGASLTCLMDLYRLRVEQLTMPVAANDQAPVDPARMLTGLWQLKEVIEAQDPAMTKPDQQGRLIRLDRHSLASLGGAGCAGPTLESLSEARARPLDADEQALIQKADAANADQKEGVAGFCLGRLFALYMPGKDGSLLVADTSALYRLQRLSGTP